MNNPLASLMFCSVCGKTIRRTHYDYKGERTFYYGCVTSRCETKNTFTHVVYDMVMAELKKELERQQVMLADYDTTPEHDARKAYETGIYDRQTYLERVHLPSLFRKAYDCRNRIYTRQNSALFSW